MILAWAARWSAGRPCKPSLIGSIPMRSTKYAPLAQLAEHCFCKSEVIGSIPMRGTKLACSRQAPIAEVVRHSGWKARTITAED